ncbi:uncharacterized protein C8A04DRAFT_34558 [Dichotomopilus funicola]|uniref:RNA helicase n=1 Tax=Dichotomopilus funicola TaxID=1934379 RepID=A0AAN6ZR63_9PEZI|nr:hypothetical protein C8A04DRAFT_34558 [Dichotomopilus funicola]
MWRTARDSVCLFCRSATRPRTALVETPQTQSWLGLRAFATRPHEPRDRRPSRMVLSDRVSQGPRSRDGPKPRREVDGPWSATNRTVANIDPDRRRGGEGRGRGGPPSRGGPPGRDRGGTRERYLGETRDKDATRFKALKMQRSLASVSYRERLTVKNRISDVDSFDQFNLLPPIQEAIQNEVLKGMVDIKPTPVQRLAVPALMGQPIGRQEREPDPRQSQRRAVEKRREEFLLAAETGSGKTLAYLLPVINALKEGEAGDEAVAAYEKRLAAEQEHRGGAPVSEWIDKFEPHPNHARPRAIVLVPTAELVSQVLTTAKKISHVAKLKVRGISATYNPLKIERNMYSHGGIDMIVATPHLLASMADSDPNILSRVSHLIVDEADSLFDRSFSAETSKILDRATPSLKQLILCSATIPRHLDNYLAAHFPHIRRIATPNLHAIPRRVQLGVIDVAKDPYRHNKLLACADAIWTIGKDAAMHEGASKDEVDVKRIMVFVNERETTQEVADYLLSRGIDAIAMHRDTPENRQSEMLASFTSNAPLSTKADGSDAGSSPVPSAARRLPNTKVIVATDLASRGIDTVAVRHVVLFDVPHTTIDFIHRLGRAGRMGRRGRGVVLVGKHDRKDVVAEVKEAMFMGQALI